MSDSEGTKNWWATLPGILTAIAGVITAIGGLLLALNQTGLLGNKSATDTPLTASAQAPSVPESKIKVTEAPPIVSTVPVQVTQNLGEKGAEARQEPNVVKLGEFTYTLLSARAEPLNSEKWALKFLIRMMNERGYSGNFWDSSFRLKVDGVPRAPDSDLNELVYGNSAKEGEVIFHVPYSARSLELVIGDQEEHGSLLIAFNAPTTAENVVRNFTFANPEIRNKLQSIALP